MVNDDFLEPKHFNKICLNKYEIIRVKNQNLSSNLPNDKYDYVFLHKKIYFKLGDNPYYHSLYITMIPLIRIGNKSLIFFEGYNQKTWGVCVDILQQKINFDGRIEAPSNFQGRGLGSYVFSDLIRWIQHYYPEFKVKSLTLSANDAQENEARDRRNEFYRKLGFNLTFFDLEEREGKAEVENVSFLQENRNPEKIESVLWKNFIKDMSVRNSQLFKNISDLERENKQLVTNNKKLKKNLRILIVFGLILIIVVILKWFR